MPRAIYMIIKAFTGAYLLYDIQYVEFIKRKKINLSYFKHIIRKLNRSWKVAIKRLIEDTKKLNAQRVSYDRNATVTPNQFDMPADWAVEIGFNKEATDTWST